MLRHIVIIYTILFEQELSILREIKYDIKTEVRNKEYVKTSINITP